MSEAPTQIVTALSRSSTAWLGSAFPSSKPDAYWTTLASSTSATTDSHGDRARKGTISRLSCQQIFQHRLLKLSWLDVCLESTVLGQTCRLYLSRRFSGWLLPATSSIFRGGLHGALFRGTERPGVSQFAATRRSTRTACSGVGRTKRNCWPPRPTDPGGRSLPAASAGSGSTPTGQRIKPRRSPSRDKNRIHDMM